MRIRRAAVAGSFYPASAGRLALAVNQLLDVEPLPIAGKVRGMVVPHAGISYSGRVAARGLALLRDRKATCPLRVVLIGPSHSARFPGASVSSDEAWETPLGMALVDESVRELHDPLLVDLPAVHEYEHCLEVILPFLQAQELPFTIVPVLTGDITSTQLAQALEQLVGEDTVFISSSDLSHYHTQAEASLLDAKANTAAPALDIDGFAACEACGKTAVLTLMQLAKSHGWSGHFVDYQTSGDITGDYSQVVGYGSYAYTS